MANLSIPIAESVAITEAVDLYVTGAGDFFETLTHADTLEVSATFNVTFTETLTHSDFIATAQTIKTNYAYYLGDAIGNIYEFSESKLGDASNNITCTWFSKRTDFSEQDFECENRFKTLYKIRLHYKDLTANTHVTVGVSTDGGSSWTTRSKTIGTGDGIDKATDFYLIVSGYLFNFKVEHGSSANSCQWTGFTVFYTATGEYLEI